MSYELVTMLKSHIEPGGFLGDLHCMLLMDDTVLLSTNREMCVQKFEVLLKFFQEYGMEINTKKTKFMAINGSLMTDKQLSAVSTLWSIAISMFISGAYSSHVVS